MTAQGLTCLGYYVVRLLEPSDGLSKGLLPKRILTVSSCLTELFPDTWALDWVNSTVEVRAGSAARFGISPAMLPALSARIGELFNSGAIAWPNVWRRADVAGDVSRDLLPDLRSVALVGVGVRPHFVEALLQQLAPQPGGAVCGVYLAAAAREPMAAGGTLVGWELLGFEAGSCHSWLCNGIQAEAATRIGRRPGPLGLLKSEAAATDVLRMMEEDPKKAEPATWVPAAVLQYVL